MLAVPLSLALLFATPDKTMVASFDNLSPEGTEGWVGDAIAETLTAHFRLAGQEVVTSEERQRGLREHGVAPDTPATLATLTAVAEKLGATRLILGSFRSSDGRLEVTARIVDVASGRTVGVVDDYGPLEDLTRIENQLAKNVLRLEGRPVPSDFALGAERHERIPFDAYEFFIKAKRTGSPAERRRLLQNALELDPTFADASLLLGQALLDEGEVVEAIDVLRAIPPEDPAYREAYFTLGIAYLAANQTRLAAEIFTRLAEQEPAASFLNNLGVVFLRRGEVEKSVIAFREAVELEPSATYAFNLGWSAWRAQQNQEARQWLAEAARLDAEDAEARLLLSALAALEGESEVAQREREAAVSIVPDLAEVDVSSLEGLERIVERLPVELTRYRFPATVATLADLDDPRDGGTQEAAPSEPVASGPESDAVAEASESGAAAPRRLLANARELRARDDLAGAVEELEQAVYVDPYSVEIRTELAEVFQEMGELDKAVGELQIALWNREDGDTLLRLAELYEAMGELDKALAHAERATELDGEDVTARQLLERLTTTQP